MSGEGGEEEGSHAENAAVEDDGTGIGNAETVTAAEGEEAPAAPDQPPAAEPPPGSAKYSSLPNTTNVKTKWRFTIFIL